MHESKKTPMFDYCILFITQQKCIPKDQISSWLDWNFIPILQNAVYNARLVFCLFFFFFLCTTPSATSQLGLIFLDNMALDPSQIQAKLPLLTSGVDALLEGFVTDSKRVRHNHNCKILVVTHTCLLHMSSCYCSWTMYNHESICPSSR